MNKSGDHFKECTICVKGVKDDDGNCIISSNKI